MYELITNKIQLESKGIRYLSDFIGEDYRTKWQKGDLVFIDSQMGKGKSYFVLNVLGAQKHGAKKILILTNRDALKNEFIKEIESIKLPLKNITLMNYQELEHVQKYGGGLKKYDYIVCDEAHYFLEDSYTNATNISFDWIMSQNESIRLFMTATSQKVNPMLEAYTKNIDYLVKVHYYWLQSDYSYMNLRRYDFSSSKIIDFLYNKMDRENEKILYFTYSINDGDKIYEKYPDNTSRIYSKHKKENLEKITQNAIDNGKCINIITVATKCLDNGINIKDSSVKYIVCDIKEPISLVQCLGRKRVKYDDIVENDIDVYIRDWTKSCKKRANAYRYILNRLNEQEQAIKEGKYNIIDKGLYGFQDYFIGIDKDGKNLYEKRVNPFYRLALELQIEEFDNMSKGKVIEGDVEVHYMNHYEVVKHMLPMVNEVPLDYKETIQSREAAAICELYTKVGEYNSTLGVYEFDNKVYSEFVEKLNIRNKLGFVKKIGVINRKLEINDVPYRIESRRKIFIDSETNTRVKKTVYYVHYHEILDDDE